MILDIKAGVKFDRDSQALGRILSGLLLSAPPPWWPAGKPLVITSGTDGSHMTHSRHYRGEAVDLRTSGLTVTQRETLRALLEFDLGPQFRVIDEVDHLHVQVKKGVVYTPRT